MEGESGTKAFSSETKKKIVFCFWGKKRGSALGSKKLTDLFGTRINGIFYSRTDRVWLIRSL